MTERLSSDLLDNPEMPDVGEMPETLGETPYDKAYSLLSALEGKKLEIMTRTNPRLVQAANVAYNLTSSFGSRYISGKIDQLMRFAVSMGGEGRKEIVDSLRAGGDMPDAYYEAQVGGGRGAPPKTFTDAVGDEDD